MRGLLGRRELPQGEGLLISPASSIHTLFMSFAIDIVFLDRDLRVRSIVREVPPFRLVRRQRGARRVLEVRAGEAQRVGIEVGMRLLLTTRVAHDLFADGHTNL